MRRCVVSESQNRFHFPRLYLNRNLRQVPDNQEVFLYPDSSISMIVEVLERVPQNEDDGAARFDGPSISLMICPIMISRFHFDSLAHDNSALSSSVESVTKTWNERGDKTPSPTVLKGTQLVRKFNSTVPDKIYILLALFRVESKNADLVLSMNIPPHTAEGDINEDKSHQAQCDFETAVESLQIIKFDLFAG